ncbi:MAG: hypothetical protein PHT95_08470 [Candidatus Omnitrophica bacterium]|nr:hypothetical protein [Candidatus Omnitrophota bacterium]
MPFPFKKIFDSGVIAGGKTHRVAARFLFSPEEATLRRRTATSAVVAALVLCSIYVWGLLDTGVRLKLTVSPRSALIGDDVIMSLTISAGRDAEITLPDERIAGEQMTLRSSAVTQSYFLFRKHIRAEYILTSYRPGIFERKPIIIPWRRAGGEWKTARIRVGRFVFKTLVEQKPDVVRRVSTASSPIGFGVTPGSASEGGGASYVDSPIRYGIRDDRPIREVLTFKDRVLRGTLIAVSIPAGVLVALFIFAVIFLKPPPEPEPPSKIALKKLKTLKARSGAGKSELGPEEQGELMSIIKEYMRSRFAFPRKEMTSGEFAETVESTEGLSPEAKAYLKQRAYACERARYSGNAEDPSNGITADDLNEDILFIQETTPPDSVDKREKGGRGR